MRDKLALSDSALSKQFASLEEPRYITIERHVPNTGDESGYH